MTKVVNLTTRQIELSGGQPLTAGGGETGGVVEGFTPMRREFDLQRAGKVKLIAEPGDPTLDDLRKQASELDIPGRSGMNRDDLLEAISAAGESPRVTDAEPSNQTATGDTADNPDGGQS